MEEEASNGREWRKVTKDIPTIEGLTEKETHALTLEP